CDLRAPARGTGTPDPPLAWRLPVEPAHVPDAGGRVAQPGLFVEAREGSANERNGNVGTRSRESREEKRAAIIAALPLSGFLFSLPCPAPSPGRPIGRKRSRSPSRSACRRHGRRGSRRG